MTDSRLGAVVGLCAVGGLLFVGSLPALAAPYARPSSIGLSDLYAERDIPVVSQDASIRWRPLSEEYISSHIAAPEYPEMRAEFGIWLQCLLAPQWLPPDLIDSAPYLRRGTARESRYHSHFYAAYQLQGCEFMVKGFFDDIRVTIKPPPGSLPAPVAAAFAEAVALHETTEPGHWGAGQDYSDAASRHIKAYLRNTAEQYFNLLSLPATEPEWERALAGITAINGGFKINWLLHSYQAYIPAARPTEPGPHAVYCTLWTNGRVVELKLHHGGVYAHDFSAFFDTFPEPVIAPVTPLNPQAVEMWDLCYWEGVGGPVDDPARATSTMIKVVVRAPYAPNVGEEMSGPETGGQPWWCNEVQLPMTELKWHIAEFAGLLGGTGLAAGSQGYPQDFGRRLGRASDRPRFLDDARADWKECEAVADRFSALRYPCEVQPTRNKMLAALRDGVRAWDMALAHWEPIVAEHPDASEALYELLAKTLDRQLAEAGLQDVGRRIGTLSNGVPLFERFGLQQAAA